MKISSISACASCHARGACGAADQEEKYLDVPLNGEDFSAGDKVKVLIAKRTGMKAVALGYVFPLVLVLVVLIALVSAGVGELTAAGLALVSLLPYYAGVYLARKRIGQSFTFSMHKINMVQ